MSIFKRLLTKSSSKKEPLDPITATERLKEVRKSIEFCETETRIGSGRTAEYAYRSLEKLIPEKNRLEQFLSQHNLH